MLAFSLPKVVSSNSSSSGTTSLPCLKFSPKPGTLKHEQCHRLSVEAPILDHVSTSLRSKTSVLNKPKCQTLILNPCTPFKGPIEPRREARPSGGMGTVLSQHPDAAESWVTRADFLPILPQVDEGRFSVMEFSTRTLLVPCK